MIKIMSRDIAIKEFLEEVGIADTETLHALFFKGTKIRNVQKRLKQLVDIKFIKVYRENMLSQNMYYTGKRPRNIAHKIVFSKLLAEITNRDIEILKYKCPYQLGNIIADGLIVVRDRGKVKIYFVEGERTKKLNINKYEELYYSRAWKEVFPTFPRILCISDKKQEIEHKTLNIRQCSWDLSDLKI